MGITYGDRKEEKENRGMCVVVVFIYLSFFPSIIHPFLSRHPALIGGHRLVGIFFEHFSFKHQRSHLAIKKSQNRKQVAPSPRAPGIEVAG